MRAFIDAVYDALPTARGSAVRKRCVLLTAPHAAGEHDPVDDPCTAAVTRALEPKVISELGLRCKALVATISRVYGDQNRLETLASPLIDDVGAALLEWAREEKDGSLNDVLHLDIHSYTATDDDFAPGWRPGAINLIHLRGDASQHAMAHRIARALDGHLHGLLPPTCVVEHPKLPTRRRAHEESNAMIELTRHLGAMAILVEMPTIRQNGTYVLYRVAERTMIAALVEALRAERDNFGDHQAQQAAS